MIGYSKAERLYSKKALFKFFLSYQKLYIKLALFAGILLLINVLLQLPMPLVTRYLIDNIIPSRDFKALNFLCVVLLLIILMRQGSGYLMRVLISKYKTRIHFDLERDLYLHIQQLPLNFFTSKPSGYILGRISEVSSAEALMADTFLSILKDFLTLIVGTVFILKLNLKLGIVSLAILPFFIFSLKAFHKKLKKLNRILNEERAKYFGKIEKNINSIEKIKTSLKEEEEGERVSKRLFSVTFLNFKSEKLSALASAVSSFIGLIAPFVVLWYGVSEVIKGNLTLGTFFAINSFLGYLYGPARRLTEIGYYLSRALAGLERVYEVFLEKKEEDEGDEISEIGDIEFSNVSFSYNGNNKVLEGLSLKIKKGEKVAIVGKSGEGKSTIVRLLLKLYQPKGGTLLISGKDIKKINKKSLREKISYISQNQKILEEDLEEKREKLRKIVRNLGIEETIEREQVFQNGFSSGEIQRLEIAEALLKKAELLIIDEGTSNLDYHTERKVLKAIIEKYEGKTILFVAHRLSSIKEFDRILILENGKITEEGGHEELLRKCGTYASLWKSHEEPVKSDNRVILKQL